MKQPSMASLSIVCTHSKSGDGSLPGRCEIFLTIIAGNGDSNIKSTSSNPLYKPSEDEGHDDKRSLIAGLLVAECMLDSQPNAGLSTADPAENYRPSYVSESGEAYFRRWGYLLHSNSRTAYYITRP